MKPEDIHPYSPTCRCVYCNPPITVPPNEKSQQPSDGPEWPKNPDGTPKRMSELTRAQQHEQFSAAIERLRPEFAQIGVKLVEGDDKPVH